MKITCFGFKKLHLGHFTRLGDWRHFIRLDPWETQYLFMVASGAKTGILEIGRPSLTSHLRLESLAASGAKRPTRLCRRLCYLGNSWRASWAPANG